ncbi:MAG: alpha-L-fucosidase, partial [Lewinella sp.]|nr:alpha-L-fucosidase [Lewinella sp.]
MRNLYFLFFFFSAFIACQPEVNPPAPVLPVPDQKQLDWQELEFYAFVHFNMNTFTNMEWGFGDESPELFNPAELDCRQWAKVCKDAGMKGIILTAKHHDGFCLWPSEYTEHSVKNSPWKDGKGDVVQELADACKEYGLKLGVYLSPWDRNHADYGTPEYLTYFRNQLRELLTNYGEVFEVWFDGANGGTGYYGGANEERRVDKTTYYDWPNTYKIVRELQPHAVLFSDAGPDVRWVGNEDGHAFRTMWSNLMRDSVYPGMPDYSQKYASGQENGTHWVPGETNVSIRPGWF